MTGLEVVAWAGAGVVGAWFGAPLAGRALARRALRRRCAEQRMLAITFDDGPGATLTPRVLAALGERQARASFFLLGERAKTHAAVVDSIAAAGHEIGCHSRGHANAWRSAPSVGVADLQGGYEDLSRWIDDRAPYRPPYGKLTLASWIAARRRGRRIAWWTCVSGDTYERLPDPAEVARRVRLAGGGVVLLHDFDRAGPDAAARADFVVETTRALLAMADAEGLAVVPFSEIAAPQR